MQVSILVYGQTRLDGGFFPLIRKQKTFGSFMCRCRGHANVRFEQGAMVRCFFPSVAMSSMSPRPTDPFEHQPLSPLNGGASLCLCVVTSRHWSTHGSLRSPEDPDKTYF